MLYDDHVWLTLMGKAWAIRRVALPIVELWRGFEPKLEYQNLDTSGVDWDAYCNTAAAALKNWPVELHVPTQKVDMETGAVIEEATTPFQLLPPPSNVCQTCGFAHDPKLPHNKQQLYYQYRFYAEHERWPTWSDALAHCEPGVRAAWEAELRRLGKWNGLETEEPRC